MKTKQHIKPVSRRVFNNPLTAAVNVSKILSAILLFLLIAHISRAVNIKNEAKSILAGPTVKNALAAEQQLANALLANNADAVGRMLDDDFALVSADGEFGDNIRPDILQR